MVDQATLDAFIDAATDAALEASDRDQARGLVASVLAGLVASLDAGDVKAAAPYAMPGPYDIAMAFGAAAVASGNYQTVEGAMAAGWAAVPAFYAARDQYVSEIAPAIYGITAAAGQVTQ